MHLENLLYQCDLVCCGSQNGSTMELIKLIVQILLFVVACGALWQGFREYKSHKQKEDNKLFSQLNKRYLNNEDIQKVVKYLRDQEPSDEEPDLYQLELFLRFFEELGIYMKTKSLDKDLIEVFFGYYLKQLYFTERGKALLKRLEDGNSENSENNLELLKVIKEQLEIK